MKKKRRTYPAVFVAVLSILPVAGIPLCCAAGELPVTPIVKGKDALLEGVSRGSTFPLLEVPANDTACVNDCIRHNQMAAVGFEVLQDQCRQECLIDRALSLLQSKEKKDYKEGVTMLCRMNDPRIVPPLVAALQRDINERTGLWACIIPALGALQDQRAVPVLTETLTNMDEDWLGRAMSARALGEIGDPSSIPSLMAAAWRADSRDAAVAALATYRDRRIIPVLLSALDTEEEQETREAAFAGLHNLGAAALPEIMASFAEFSPEYPDTGKRLLLCRLLAASGDEKARKILFNSVDDPDDAVGKCAEKYVRRR